MMQGFSNGYNNMMNGTGYGGWPTLLLGAAVVIGIVLLVILVARSSGKK